jgi:hypothetical protein
LYLLLAVVCLTAFVLGMLYAWRADPGPEG